MMYLKNHNYIWSNIKLQNFSEQRIICISSQIFFLVLVQKKVANFKNLKGMFSNKNFIFYYSLYLSIFEMTLNTYYLRNLFSHEIFFSSGGSFLNRCKNESRSDVDKF